MTWAEDLGRMFGEAVGVPGPPPPAPGKGLHENIERFIKLMGSGRKAAAALGVPESTFRGWRHGVTPRHYDTRMREIINAGRKRVVRNVAQLGDLTVKGTFRYSNDIRKRTIHPGRLIPPAALQHLAGQWAAGETDEAVGRRLAKLIDTYYQPLKYVNISEVGFE